MSFYFNHLTSVKITLFTLDSFIENKKGIYYEVKTLRQLKSKQYLSLHLKDDELYKYRDLANLADRSNLLTIYNNEILSKLVKLES